MPTSKLSEDEINKKILKILNGLPELDIETAFAILEEENGKIKNVLQPSELFQGTDHCRCQDGSCHWH